MKRLPIFWLLVLLFLPPLVSASVFKGQRAYMRNCKSCHKSGGDLAKSHTQDEWEEYFDQEAKLLTDMHKKNKEAIQVLHSKKFRKNIRHLRQFFMKYASDSGNVPACN